MKHGQKVCLGKYLVKLCKAQKLDHLVKSKKKLTTLLSPVFRKGFQNVCLHDIFDKYKSDHLRSKTRSQGLLLGKPCVHSRDHIFRPLLMKDCWNICLDNLYKMGKSTLFD